MELYSVKSRLNEIQKKEMERIQQQQELDTELDIIIEHLDYTNEHNFKRSDIEKLHGKLLDDIKDNTDVLEHVNYLHNAVNNQGELLDDLSVLPLIIKYFQFNIK